MYVLGAAVMNDIFFLYLTSIYLIETALPKQNRQPQIHQHQAETNSAALHCNFSSS
jgi:hypothetical protein